MSYERTCQKENLDAFKIGETYRSERDTIEPYLVGGTYKSIGSLPEKVSLILRNHIQITGAMNIPMEHQSLRVLEVLL